MSRSEQFLKILADAQLRVLQLRSQEKLATEDFQFDASDLFAPQT